MNKNRILSWIKHEIYTYNKDIAISQYISNHLCISLSNILKIKSTISNWKLTLKELIHNNTEKIIECECKKFDNNLKDEQGHVNIKAVNLPNNNQVKN